MKCGLLMRMAAFVLPAGMTPEGVPAAGTLPSSWNKPTDWDKAPAGALHQLKRRAMINATSFGCFLAPKALILLLLMSLAYCGCSDDSRNPPGTGASSTDEEAVGAVVSLLSEMPDWTSFSLNREYEESRAKIHAVVKQISGHSLNVIRRAMKEYREDKGLAIDGKLLIVNRFLFDLPATVRRDSPHFRFFGGGWPGLPISGDPYRPDASDEMDMRWPWSVHENGRWQLTGRYAGFMGEAYRPLDAFDYYNKHFGRRKIENTR